MTWLVIRARSDVGVESKIKLTLHSLNLTKVNHAVIVPENEQTNGMLAKAKDYITWGEISGELTKDLLTARGKMTGDKPLTDEAFNDTDFDGIESFAMAIAEGDVTMKEIPGLKRVLRLHPPRGSKGWGGIKRSFQAGGALGYRGDNIEHLVRRMF